MIIFKMSADVLDIEVNKIIFENISYEYFFTEYLLKNKPAILRNIGNDWGASKLWIKENKFNIKYLNEKYGDSVITIYDCNKKYFNSQCTSTMKLSQFLSYLIEYESKDNTDLPLYYLKDWHLKNKFPEDNFYEVPEYFQSDWLNEYLVENNEDDYRFVYMGPKNSWTPFHVDVFTSFSWSVNICGRKKWILLPPGEEIKLLDSHGNLPHDLSSINLNSIKHFQIVQNAGEAIFVPSLWHHQVMNLEDTISINHNWINGCNIKSVWLSMEQNLKKVKKEINDLIHIDNFLDQCQLILKATFGMNFLSFFKFIEYIGLKRISQRNNNLELTKNIDVEFDLKAVKDTLMLMQKHDDISKSKDFTDLDRELKDLFHKLAKYC